MEKLQGPINPCFIGEDLEVGWLEEFVSNIGNSYKFEDTTTQSLEDKMPFLQMLQGVEEQAPLTQSKAAFPFMQEPNFQLLLRLEHQKLLMEHQGYGCNFTSTAELESCVTNINTNQGIVKSEINNVAAAVEEPPQNNQRVQRGRCKRGQVGKSASSAVQVVAAAPREKRKRKRSSRPVKNKEEVETQRMTHIAVERNRRRQMNDHLSSLRSLMPPSYVQRGDQASIIGGAIDFVKELEQLHQSLQAQKRMRQCEENADVSASSSTSSSSNVLNNMFMTSPSSPFQFRNFHSHEEGNGNGIPTEFRKNNNEEFSAENRSAIADIEVVVIQNHVNLKIQCQRRPGQLLKAIVAFEELRLTILHLNITSLHSLVHYSFNLKMEDDCKLGSADEVASAVQQIFSLINLS